MWMPNKKMDDNTNVNAAILERLEKVVQSLQENCQDG